MVVLKPNAGEILTSEINKRGLKLTYVTKKAGIEYTYASAILSGRKRLTTEKALQIAKAIGLSYEKILN